MIAPRDRGRSTRPGPRTANHGGFAILIALFAMVVIAALVGAAVSAVTRGMETAGDRMLAARSFASAEYGAHVVTTPAEWNAGWTALPLGSRVLRVYTPDVAVLDSVRITRLAGRALLIDSDARAITSSRRPVRRHLTRLILVDSAGAPHSVPAHGWTMTF
jgi:hypothetical protein